jgi:hypothetical protein
MKKVLLTLLMPLTVTLLLAGCGLSEEERVKMEERQKKHADSLVETIKSAMSTRDSISKEKGTNDSLLIKTGASEKKDKNK